MISLPLGMLWRELVRRSQRHNDGTELMDALTHISVGIAEDVETFQQIMQRLGVGINPIKIGLAVAAERLGRLKPNGRMATYSPLSRFLELDVFWSLTSSPWASTAKSSSGRPCGPCRPCIASARYRLRSSD
jgi:hypothetical protein